ncbi:MAG: hypothetical protein K2J20_00090, partial [Bacilli bacterium]|nr:hypothetical protein [Bacilli bacterium]
MKIWELLKNAWDLLKNVHCSEKEATETVNQTLASLNSIVPMPTREDFLEDESKLDLIDKYKKEYLFSLK